jgi:hypothetical protein
MEFAQLLSTAVQIPFKKYALFAHSVHVGPLKVLQRGLPVTASLFNAQVFPFNI